MFYLLAIERGVVPLKHLIDSDKDSFRGYPKDFEGGTFKPATFNAAKAKQNDATSNTSNKQQEIDKSSEPVVRQSMQHNDDSQGNIHEKNRLYPISQPLFEVLCQFYNDHYLKTL